MALMCSVALAADVPFRTDGGDDKLPWFQLKPGEFPPAGSSHHISGELIALDHVNRTGTIRPDRDDSQRRGEWDIGRPFTMLPYGSFRFHGAPAELRDIPIGTHLHGEFYADELPPEPPAVKGRPKAKGPIKPATFTRAIRFEDDISRNLRLGRSWRVENYNPEAKVLVLLGLDKDGKADAKPTNFQVNDATRVWKGRGFASLADLSPGQTVQVNLTVCTLKGPGRCIDIWLDSESIELAAARQLEVHRQHQREHGLAGFVEVVDNQAGIVTVDLFDGVDPKLIEDFKLGESAAGAVAIESLRTYDQINDVKRGPVTKIEKLPPTPGFSGVRISFKPSNLLEGYRPKRVVRLFAAPWKVDDLPREEKAYK